MGRIRDRWPSFQATRKVHLASHAVGLTVPERIAENILFDLFTNVLDWEQSDVRWQQDRVDLLVTRVGVKQLVVEAKRPGSFDGPGSIQRAMRQARGYAEELGVDKIAVSDGCVLVAADLVAGTSTSRLRVHLADDDPPDDLWWISTRGIYRSPDHGPAEATPDPGDDQLRHPKYALPARCFAYVGHPDKPVTWKLPYLCVRTVPSTRGGCRRPYRLCCETTAANTFGCPKAVSRRCSTVWPRRPDVRDACRARTPRPPMCTSHWSTRCTSWLVFELPSPVAGHSGTYRQQGGVGFGKPQFLRSVRLALVVGTCGR